MVLCAAAWVLWTCAGIEGVFFDSYQVRCGAGRGGAGVAAAVVGARRRPRALPPIPPRTCAHVAQDRISFLDRSWRVRRYGMGCL
jgi:hypothetical protein